MSDVTFDMSSNSMHVHQVNAEPWKVTLVDTGDETMTGGRLKRVQPYVENEEAFCMTYGDGVSDVDISKLITFHKSQGTLATVTATLPPGRFGALDIEGDKVIGFKEKPKGDGVMINGGFFVLSPKVLDLIDGDHATWEQAPLESLAVNNELSVFKHQGFWQPMDTLRDKTLLEELWASDKAPWKTW